MHPDWINGLIGGALIGGASGLLLVANGRIAGISGIIGGFLSGGARREQGLFLLGLLVSPLLYLGFGGAKRIEVSEDLVLLTVAGLLVGFGARLGSGCTSGHGVCGAARLSRRSIYALATFMSVAVATVFLTGKI